MVNIRQVAAAAGVSIATVSNALKGTGRVSDGTRDRVRRVARDLGYGQASRHVLGLAVTTFGDRSWNFAGVDYFARSISTATAAAHARGYALTVLPSSLGTASWRSLPVDGVLLIDSPQDDPVVRTLRGRGLPIAFDGRPEDVRPGEVWVDNDHAVASRSVLDQLAAQGVRRVALVAGRGRDHYNRAWIADYQAWCASRGQAELLVSAARPDAAGALLGLAEPPDAIYTTYDWGRELLTLARGRGLRVPEDLMLACVSEDPRYAATDPPVTTLSLLPGTSVALAVDALVDLVECVPVAPQPPVPSRLAVRESTLRISSLINS